MPTFYTIQTNPATDLVLIPYPSVIAQPEVLIYSKGGGVIFPNLPLDLILEPGNFHGGNPIVEQEFTVKACDKLSITTEKKEIVSQENSRGLMDIEYPNSGSAIGGIHYFWNNVFTSVLGIYNMRNIASLFDFFLDKEMLTIFTNDVNTVPRVGDYIVFNEVPINYFDVVFDPINNVNYYPEINNINNKINRMPVFQGKDMFQAKIIEVTPLSGLNDNIKYLIRLDKSYELINDTKYGITLLNRLNTSIQKELFYETFEAIEIHRQQLLGDPYDNISNINLPLGRFNHLNYDGHEALGYANLISNFIGNKNTPVMIFEVNNEVKDRFSFNANTYDNDDKPTEIHFEFHLPNIMINDNTYFDPNAFVNTPVENGRILENIFVAKPAFSIETQGIGKYSGLYLKTDTEYTRRYGFVFHDLRLVVMDDSEVATVLGYNSNRNYTLPRPNFTPGKGNYLINPGMNIDINIVSMNSVNGIIINTGVPHNLIRGMKVFITGVIGNTAANGEYFVDVVSTNEIAIYSVMPQYNPNGSVVPGTGTPVYANGTYVENTGKIVGTKPFYNFFFTYRVRNKQSEQTMPYADLTDFNFTSGNEIDNSNGSLYITIPTLNWAKQQNNLSPYNLGFNILNGRPQYGTVEDTGWGIDIIVGEYETDPNDPRTIIGKKEIMCIPVTYLNTDPATFDQVVLDSNNNPLYTIYNEPISGTGFRLEIKRVEDYNQAILDTNTSVHDYSFDLINNLQLYTFNQNQPVNSQTPPQKNPLLVGKGKWTLGNIIYKNQAEITRTTFNISVPADAWNDSTNPSFRPENNPLIGDKYITEVGLILADDNGEKPMIYTKIAPAVKKTNDLDIQINLQVDF